MTAASIRPSSLADRDAIIELHRRVAVIGGGIAREPDEITSELVEGFLTRATTTGVALAAWRDGQLVGEIHASRMVPRCFSHILADLTIVIAPAAQGQGVGRALFTELIRIVREERPAFAHIELWVRESNARGVALYESLGFTIAVRVPERIRVGDRYETDLLMLWTR